MALTPFALDPRVFESGLYDCVRNDPRFQAALERLPTRMRARVRETNLRS